MRTRSVIVIGFAALFVVFGIASYIQWDYSQMIKDVSEYNRDMSIPAITILQNIKLDFQIMHVTSTQMTQHEPSSEEYQEFERRYQESRISLYENLQRYDDLTYVKDSEGEFHAPLMMQNQMQNYVDIFREKSNEHHTVLEQCQNEEISKTDAIILFESIEEEFHLVFKEDMQMEIQGMEDTQNQIVGIEDRMALIFLISGVIAAIILAVIVIFTSLFVSRPLSSLVKMTQKIAQGDFTPEKITSKNTDVNEILESLNQMSTDLEKYKSKIIMQEKLSSIGELSSRLAHDIRNPLTVIKVTLDLMKAKNNLTPDEIDKFERVDNAMQRITHQVDNVLDFVKGKPMVFKKQSLQKIVDSAILDIVKPGRVEIETKGHDVVIECDFEAMKIVLINLIFNSIQAMGDAGKVKITTETKDSQAIIEIEDSGPGIPEDRLEKIFEPLYTTKQEGTGLGLASCKSIIEQHNGNISVKNNPTRFIIEIPQEHNSI